MSLSKVLFALVCSVVGVQVCAAQVPAAGPPAPPVIQVRPVRKVPNVEKPINPIRMLVEGRLKIPYTAMQIGCDANLGDGRDDVRFVFGTRFDIGEAISRVAGFQQ